MKNCEHKLEKNKMVSKVCCRSCYSKQYYKDNAEQRKQYRKDNAEQLKQYDKQYRKDNVEKIKQYYKDNAEQLKQYSKQYRKDNAEQRKQYDKQYYKDNAEQCKQYDKQYYKDRRNSDPLFKMITNMRSRLNQYSKLKGVHKTWDLVGCSPSELREWLQCQFKKGMSWDNQGKWHIDHILPLCAAETTEDFKLLAHYTNLQPLWAEDNLRKGGK